MVARIQKAADSSMLDESAVESMARTISAGGNEMIARIQQSMEQTLEMQEKVNESHMNPEVQKAVSDLLKDTRDGVEYRVTLLDGQLKSERKDKIGVSTGDVPRKYRLSAGESVSEAMS
jgi:hypothetical protein